MRHVVTALALVVLLVVPLAAQGSPVILESSFAGGALHLVSRVTGGITSSWGLPSSYYYHSLAHGPGDDSVLLMAHQYQPTTVNRLQSVSGGKVVTLGSFARDGDVGELDIDDAGDVIVLWRSSAIGSGLYTFPVGTSTLTTVLAWPSGLDLPMSYCEHLSTGDRFFAGSKGNLYRVDRLTSAVTTITKVGAPYVSRYALENDPLTGDILVATQGADLLRYDPVASKLTTAYRSAQFAFLMTDVSYDQLTRGYFVTGWRGFGHGNAGTYALLDAQAKEVFATGVNHNSYFEKSRSLNGRAFTALTTPVNGGTYKVRFNAFAQAGVRYQAAFSFSHRPGIATPAGTVPLAADPMFYLSLIGAPIFRGLSGVLDSSGQAVVEVDLLPIPQTQGLRMHLAAVTLGSAGIRSIFGPHAFSIR